MTRPFSVTYSPLSDVRLGGSLRMKLCSGELWRRAGESLLKSGLVWVSPTLVRTRLTYVSMSNPKFAYTQCSAVSWYTSMLLHVPCKLLLPSSSFCHLFLCPPLLCFFPSDSVTVEPSGDVVGMVAHSLHFLLLLELLRPHVLSELPPGSRLARIMCTFLIGRC